MYYVEKELKDFSAAHRLIKGYVGKCTNLHGHNYRVRVTLGAERLNELDFVMDFDEIKQLFDEWVQANWDHATLVNDMDVPLLSFVREQEQQHYVFENNKNTTAENLAAYLFAKFSKILDKRNQQNIHQVQLLDVRVAESLSSFAGYHCGERMIR